MIREANRCHPGLSGPMALGILGMVASIALTALIVSHETLLFKSMPFNGAFQLYNPLHRLAAGESIGGDFDFFHGSGTLLLHYPLFSLLGGDLLASELSRHFMSLLFFFGCFHLFWRRQPAAFRGISGKSDQLMAVQDGGFWQSPANTGDRCVYSVSVRYAVANPFAAIPVAGKLTRYLLSRETVSGTSIITHLPASLPPTESLWEFPIILGHGEHARFALDRIMALPHGSAQIHSIGLEEISHDTKIIGALAAARQLRTAPESGPAAGGSGD